MAFPAEIAPSQGYQQPQGLNPNITWPQEFSPTTETEKPYEHPLQSRVAGEWMPLMTENGQGRPASRLIVFRDRVDSFASFTNGLTPEQLDGDMDPDLADKVVQEASHIKIAALGVGTKLGIDVGSFMDKKMLQKMQEKYPPRSVYYLIRSGMTPLDAMSYLKRAYNSGNEIYFPPVPIPEEEEKYRLPRVPAFGDPYQDVSDTWQRRAFGKYLRPSDRLPNLFGESQELLEEFDGMTPEDVNSLTQGKKITANDPETNDPTINKLISIAGEIADVLIAADGYTAALGRDQEIDGNVALDATIQRYKKTRRLVREGMDEHRAMELLRTVDHRLRGGDSRLPYKVSPAIAAIIAGIAMRT